MKMKKTFCIAVLLTTVLLSSCAEKKSILLVTDVHFNPFTDTTLVASLQEVTTEKWDSVFAINQSDKIAVYHEETSPKLLHLLLESINQKGKKISSVFFTGDILAHKFNEMFYYFPVRMMIAKSSSRKIQLPNTKFQNMFSFLLVTEWVLHKSI